MAGIDIDFTVAGYGSWHDGQWHEVLDYSILWLPTAQNKTAAFWLRCG
ncbi:MAG: hypothetical protein ABI351_03480 [Herbaspirillum sp.]